MEELKTELLQLPRDANALSLVHLLNEIREEYVPKEAVRSIWRKLLASSTQQRGTGSSSMSALKNKRARSAANIPIVRSRLLEARALLANCLLLISLMGVLNVVTVSLAAVQAQAGRVRPQAAAEPHLASPGTQRFLPHSIAVANLRTT